MSNVTRQEAIVAEARGWLGTPWHHRAAVRGAGVDCGMFAKAVFQAQGLLPVFDEGDYPADWMMHRSEERFLGWVEQFADQVETPAPGDVALWRYGRCFSHIAIVIAWPAIIHAYRREGGVVLGDGTLGELAGREVRFYTVRG